MTLAILGIILPVHLAPDPRPQSWHTVSSDCAMFGYAEEWIYASLLLLAEATGPNSLLLHP